MVGQGGGFGRSSYGGGGTLFLSGWVKIMEVVEVVLLFVDFDYL